MIKYIYLFLFILQVQSLRFFPFLFTRKKYTPIKKYITIMPGGIRGFYMLGICKYLQETENLSDFYYLGASAGAWCSLICCYNKDIDSLMNELFQNNYLYTNITSPNDLQYKFRRFLLDNYNSNDFDLSKLNIGLCQLEYLNLETKIISNFNSLERAIDCCIVSSHIPYITSKGLIKRFDNKIVFDGGLTSGFPPKYMPVYYNINPSLYDEQYSNTKFLLQLIKFNHTSDSLQEMYNLGYENAKKNKIMIKDIFNR